MILVTTDFITGKEIHTIGMVKGQCIQSVHVGKDLLSGFKTIVGGELTTYTEMMDKARDVATQRMCAEAEKLGADGVVAVRCSSSAVTQGASEVMLYGTAVKFL